MFCEVDIDGYFVSDAPYASDVSDRVAPHAAQDGTKPDGMRKARYVNGSWVDEEASLLEADLLARKKKDVEAAVDVMILSECTDRGYNSVDSCTNYKGSTNAQWDAEASYMLARRTQVWEYVIAQLAEVELGNRTLPTPEEAVFEVQIQFPLTWPEV